MVTSKMEAYKFRIGDLQLETPMVFAPLAGISNLPMRLLAKEACCALVCSEMISANGLIHGSAKTRELLCSTAAEHPLSVQLFGSDGQMLAEAARQVAESGADIVDINFGCAVKKILKSGSGAALMKDPKKSEPLLKAVRAAIDIPLTIKIRSGWNPSGEQALEMVRVAQGCGVDAISVHPRTAQQGFGGCADWSMIQKIKQTANVPIIGNGDVCSAEDALNMLEGTGCDAVMIGRAAIGNPFIFTQFHDILMGRCPSTISAGLRIRAMYRYLEDSVQYLGETRACRMMRSRLAWFAKGLPHAAAFRRSIRHISSEQQAKNLIRVFELSLAQADGAM